MSHLSLVDAAFIFSSVTLGLAAYTVARAFATWVAHQTHSHSTIDEAIGKLLDRKKD